jgi:hypothetical protein
LTYHVGEDFYHPIDGMRNMDAAINGARMDAGDRIGHGLAAEWDLTSFGKTRGKFMRLPRGVLLDNLVWIRERLRSVEDLHVPVAMQIEGEAQRLARYVYDHRVRWDCLVYSLTHRHRPISLSLKYMQRKKDHLPLDMEIFDTDCRARRCELITLPDIFLKGTVALEAVRRGFLSELEARRIIIEMNPSSNLATAGIKHLRNHPFFGCLHNQTSIPRIVSLNTDDPGVFGTCIELEYALMLSAMVENGIEKRDALDILEKIRTVTMQSTFQ